MEKVETNKYLGYIYAILATAIWSGNFIVARGLNEALPPVSLAFYRWTVGLVVVLPLAARALYKERKVVQDNIGFLLLASFFGVTIFNTLIYVAAQSTTAINLSLIAITFPVFIIILSRIFFGEAITFAKIIGIIVVALGVVLLLTKGDISRLTQISFAIGDLWMLVAAITFAIYSVLLRKKPAGLGALSFQLITFSLGIIMLAPFYIWEISTLPMPELSMGTIGSIVYIGVFASLVAYVLWLKAIMLVGPSHAGMIYYSLPVFCGVLAYMVLGEEIGMTHLIATVLIIAGIVLANYKKR